MKKVWQRCGWYCHVAITGIAMFGSSCSWHYVLRNNLTLHFDYNYTKPARNEINYKKYMLYRCHDMRAMSGAGLMYNTINAYS